VLDGYTERTETYEGTPRQVFRTGSGPAVVVIHEVPGITPAVAEFGRRVAAIGCTAVLPSLFGTPGRAMSPRYVASSMAHICVSKEFTTWATGRTSPVTTWLRALARAAHEECGGPGVGAVGMCATGGFALAMMVDDTVVAPVLSQPSLPFAVTPKQKRDLGISPADLDRVKQRVEDDGVCVVGLRYKGDKAVPDARFRRLRDELGRGFDPEEFEGRGHSVLTEDLQEAGVAKVLAFLRERLLPPA
jgi:dienelactone hydrolase